MIHDRRFLLVLLGVAIISIAALPFVLGAEAREHEQRRKKISVMTAAERARLERNFESFLQLSEPDRERFRNLQAQLSTDAASQHGRTHAALQTYAQWLQTIPPYQRDALLGEQEPKAKLVLIRGILDQQKEDRIELHLDARQEQRLGPIPTLNAADLSSVLSVLSSAAEAVLIAPEQQLEGYDGLQRTLKLFEMLGRENRRLLSLLNEGRLVTLRAAISEEDARRKLEVAADGEPGSLPIQKYKMALTLWKNIELAVDQELRQRQMTDQKLHEAFDQLPEAEQEELLELAPALFRLELRRRAQNAASTRPIDRQFVLRFLRPNPADRPFRGGGQALPNPRPGGLLDRQRRNDAGASEPN